MTKLKYTSPKTEADLKKTIASAVNSASAMRNKVQVAAVAILYHANKHNDWSHANALIDQLGNGVKRDSLVAWFEDLGGLVRGDKPADGFVSWKGPEHIQDNYQRAMYGDKMWYEYKKDSGGFSGYCLEEELKKVIKRYDDMKKKVVGMQPEDQGKVDLVVNSQVVEMLLAVTGHFELLEEDAVTADLGGELKKQLSAG